MLGPNSSVHSFANLNHENTCQQVPIRQNIPLFQLTEPYDPDTRIYKGVQYLQPVGASKSGTNISTKTNLQQLQSLLGTCEQDDT